MCITLKSQSSLTPLGGGGNNKEIKIQHNNTELPNSVTHSRDMNSITKAFTVNYWWFI
jgi:hypothetical protein